MFNFLQSTIIIFIIVLIWFWYMEHNHPNFKETWIDNVLCAAKTGDLILFKATDNTNSSKIFCYYTHIGVVYRPDTGNPQIFEAAGTNGMDLYNSENHKGIFLTDLRTRLERYKGRLYYKHLARPISQNVASEFTEFIKYAHENMQYNYNVMTNGIKKGLLIEKCGNATNCGELAMLSLIKLGILDASRYNQRVFHHLHWMSNLDEADNGYYYDEPLRIKISPFA